MLQPRCGWSAAVTKPSRSTSGHLVGLKFFLRLVPPDGLRLGPADTAIGRTFKESLQKCLRSLEIGRSGLGGEGKSWRIGSGL